MIQYKKEVERFGIFELQLKGREDDGLFADSGLWAEFSKEDRHFVAEGFYDGEGRLLIRFMPDEEGNGRFASKARPPQPEDTPDNSIACRRGPIITDR